MKAMPQIQKFMTPNPHTIGHDLPLRTALSLMREHRIRHLPVQNGGKLVGMLTDRDIKLAGSFSDSSNLKVEEVMSPEVFTVTPDSPVDRVVNEMASRKYGSAVVQQENGKVVGIFTAVDGLHFLGETLQSFYRGRE
ncbi:MAG: CBS domain-containing protein [Bdellovibrionales bacterium]|nr:CBS domain-containing protein [Bdellovibrionales bacterium]